MKTYRVLFNGDDTGSIASLPLISASEMVEYGIDGNQEWCGVSCEGDFSGGEDGGASGEVWEFVTTQPSAMEQALNSMPNVLAYSVRDGGLEY